MKYIPFNLYLDFLDPVLKLIAAVEKVSGYTFNGYWMDLGCPDDHAQVAEDFTTMHTQFLLEDK